MDIKDIRRQGDVLLVARDKAPAVTRSVPREAGRIVLMHGEVTGHAHAIEGYSQTRYVETGTADAAERWLQTGHGGAVLTHEEHGPHELLPDTDYEQWYQFEYEPEDLRLVAD